MRRSSLRTGAFLFGALLSGFFSLNAGIQWIEKNHDFGLMKEILGPQTGVSRFVNTGNTPISVIDARPSCGCTGVEFSDAETAPGDTLSIAYTYDPAGRPGRFEKSIKVWLSDGTEQVIMIRGNVLGAPESLDMFYPVEAGPLRLSDSVIIGGNVTDTRTPGYFIKAYNQTTDTIRPLATSESQALRIECSQQKLGPGDLATFVIYFKAGALGEYGPVELPVSFVADSASPDARSVTVPLRATVLPSAKSLSGKDLAKAPRCFPVPDPVDLGIIRHDAARPVGFAILNDGGSPLRIRKIYSDIVAVKYNRLPKEIKPDKSVRVSLELDLRDLPAGPFRIPLRIITDDPVTPVKEFTVAGEIR